MLNLKDLNGGVYIAEGTSTLEENLSSDITINFELPYTEVNKDFIYNIGAHWKVSGVKGANDRTEYVIKYVNRKTLGGKPFVECTAMTLFMEKIKTTNLYNYYEGEYNLELMLNTIFNGTGFSYQVKEAFDNSLYIETFGNGESRLEVFKRVLELWQLEFVINGDVIELYKKIIRKPDYFLHDNLNATNISLEEDASEFYTYAKGYGDINSGEPLNTAGVPVVYEHPLANVVGRKETIVIIENDDNTSPNADVIYDKVYAECKRVVDNSLKITITSDFLALKEYPEAYPKLGDEITFVASNIDYDAIVRLVGISTKRNHKGDILTQNVTFGEQPLIKRRNMKAMQTTNFIYAVTSGDKLIPSNMIDTKGLVTEVDQTQLDESISGLWGDAVADLANENSKIIEEKRAQLTADYNKAVADAEARVRAAEPTFMANLEAEKTNIKNMALNDLNSGTARISSNAIDVKYGFINQLATDALFSNTIQAQSLDAFRANIYELRSDIISTGSITADALRADNAMINKLTANELAAENIASSYAIINKIKSTSITTNQLSIQEISTEAGRIPGAISIMRPDGARAIIDGVPQNELAAQRQQFLSPGVSRGGQFYQTTNTEPSYFEIVYFEHDGRYLNGTFAYTLASASASSSVNAYIRMREFSTGRGFAEKKVLISRGSTSFVDLSIDMGVPTYEVKAFYLEFHLDSGTAPSNTLGVRCNKLSQKG
ncbi:hypothetical protein EVU91_04355 [Macrococcoides bohemicum]|uniref:phage tail protein n=1 Tax=Macrococcoides bohemicum TaxID=1903056 RepID=UPI0010592E6A|nr:phage tail protein [Macrococcus bohemicus]TDL39382.1 hypothetical protein EVU91_04355 [Macrococcus bohemicus]